MKRKLNLLAVSALFAGAAFAGNNPVDEPWWPSEFGPDDEMGASQYITPQKRIEAAKLVKKGKMALLGTFAYCHMNLIARRAISNFENLDLDELSKEKAYEFLFAWAPLKLVGATGSPGNPVATW